MIYQADLVIIKFLVLLLLTTCTFSLSQYNEVSRTGNDYDTKPDTKTEWSEDNIKQHLTEIPDATFDPLLEDEALKCDMEMFENTSDNSSAPFNENVSVNINVEDMKGCVPIAR